MSLKRIFLVILTLLCGFSAFAHEQQNNDKMSYTPFTLMKLPISETVRVGHWLYLSDSTALVNGKAIPGGIVGQTNWDMQYIQSILKKNGTDLNHVVRMEVLLPSWKYASQFDSVYKKYFSKGRYPVRVLYVGAKFTAGIVVGMNCVAYIPSHHT